MAITPVNIGAAPNDGTGDPLRTAFDKVNDNFTDVQSQITTAAGQATDAQAAADAAQITANNAIPQSQAGIPSGVATLDAGGKVPKTQITLNASDVGAEAIGTAAAEVDLLDAELAPVAKSGDYADLLNTPTIPGAQVNSDWDAVSGVSQILNKPVITPFAETLLDDADAAAMRTTLGAVGLTGNEIVAGIKTFSSDIILPSGYSFSAYANANQAVASGVFTKVTFGVEDFDSGGNFASSRFTAAVTGIYMFSGQIRCAGTDMGAVAVSLYKNGVAFNQCEGINRTSASSPLTGRISGILQLAAGDYVEVFGIIVATSPIFEFNSLSATSRFMGTLIRRTV